MAPEELKRRKSILTRHIGDRVQIKREFRRKWPDKVPADQPAILLDVRRTRVELTWNADADDNWLAPIADILLPGSMEHDPRQRELFPVEPAA